MVAPTSVLVFDVLGVNEVLSSQSPPPITEADHKVLRNLGEVYESITKKNLPEAYHDALQLKEEAATLFALGYLDLRARASVERMFYCCCAEILGDLHNLFGDTDAVHVELSDEGGYTVEHVVEGDAVDEVLAYVQYDRRALVEKVRRTIEVALRKGEMSSEESARLVKRYEQGLQEYTYLSRDE